MAELIRSSLYSLDDEEMDFSIHVSMAGHLISNTDYISGPRNLNDYEMVLVIKGNGWYEQGNNKFYVGENDLFVLFPRIKHCHYAKFQDPWEVMWISFRGSICEKVFNLINITKAMPVIKGIVSSTLIQLCKNIMDNLDNNDDYYALSATGYAQILFSELIALAKGGFVKTAVKNPNEEVIKKILTFISTNYSRDINIDLLCKYVNYSRSYVSRIFKDRVGISIPEYTNEIRIKRAKFLLENTEMNINEIAKSVGYEDPFYFSRIFKNKIKVSPIHYKKSIKSVSIITV